jgi:hypothetical protein
MPVVCQNSIDFKSSRIPIIVAEHAAESDATSDGALTGVGVGRAWLDDAVAQSLMRAL